MEEINRQLLRLSVSHWQHNEFLTWQWWVKASIFTGLIIFWLFWCKGIDKKRRLEISFYGLLMSLFSLTLDVIGTYLVFWKYPIRLFPLNFSEIHDFVVIPVAFMLVYHLFPAWPRFIIANLLLAAFASFVMEPLFILMSFYEPIVWKHIYSLLLLFLLAVISKAIVDKLRYTESI